MRREMLTELNTEEGGEGIKFGVPEDKPPRDDERLVEPEKDYSGVDWQDQVSGTKRVLSMHVSFRSLDMGVLRY